MNRVIEQDMQELIQRCDIADKFRDTTVMITGGNGMIAKYYTYFLLALNQYQELNIKIICLVRNGDKAKQNFSEFLENPQLELIVQDVCEPIVYEGKVDYILHAAGAASPYFILNDPVGIIKANTLGTINVLEFARNKRVRNILFASTREIYGKTADEVSFIKETDIGGLDPLESRTCYPESKRMAESICKAYLNQYQVPFTAARIAHTYGPGMLIDNDGRVMADFINFVVKNEDIVLNSAGTARRSFCYIADAADALTRILLEGEIGEAYNLANETELYEIKDTAQKLVDLYPEKGLKVILNGGDNFTKGGYNKIPIVQMDTGRLESLGWKPQIKLEEGMRRTVDSFME